MIALKYLKFKIMKILPTVYFINLENVLEVITIQQPKDKEIEEFLDIPNANIKDLLFYVISNWKFNKRLDRQETELLVSLNKILK